MEASSRITGIKFHLQILIQLEVTDRWSVGRITGPPEPSVWSVFTPAAFVSFSLFASSWNEYNGLFWIPDALLQSWYNRRDHLVSSYYQLHIPRITFLKRKCKSALVGYRENEFVIRLFILVILELQFKYVLHPSFICVWFKKGVPYFLCQNSFCRYS